MAAPPPPVSSSHQLPPPGLPSSPESPDPTDPHGSQPSLNDSRPVLQYRKPGWRLRTFDFECKVREYPSNKLRIASFAQIGIGIICLSLSVAVIAVGAWGYRVGAGMWGGALFTLAGGIGLVAHLSLKLRFIVATFALSTASFVIAFVLFVITSVGIEQDLHHMRMLMAEDSYGSILRIQGLESQIHQHRLKLGFNGVLVVMGVLELGVSMAHALLNARHFFVWDPGCTSESEYVYSNPGAEIEPDLPPTYQEVMGTTLTTNQRHSQYSDHPAVRGDPETMYGPTSTSRYTGRESRPVDPDAIEMRPASEWNSYRNSHVPRSGHGTDHQGHHARPPHYAQPPAYNDKLPSVRGDHPPSVRDRENVRPHEMLPARTEPKPYGHSVHLGRGHPQDGELVQEPMYRRPNRHPDEPIYANIQDYMRQRPLSEHQPDRRQRSDRPQTQYDDRPQTQYDDDHYSPPRPPYPHGHDPRSDTSGNPVIDDRYRAHNDLRMTYNGREVHGLDVESHM